MSPALLVRAFFERALIPGDVAALAEIATEDCLDHNPMPFQPPGRAGVGLKLAFWRAAAPRAVVTVHGVEPSEQGAEARWTTDPGTGEPPLSFLGRFTVQDGRICALEVDRVG